MNKFEQPEPSAAPESEDQQQKEINWKKRVKKQLITGALLGASVIGGGVAAVHEAGKLDSEEQGKPVEKAEVKKSFGIVLEKISVPPHAQPMPTMVGKSMGVMPALSPAAYSLKMSVEGRDRLVSVEKAVFDYVAVGDKVPVLENGQQIRVEKNAE